LRRLVVPDFQLAEELRTMAKHRMDFWQEVHLENKYPSIYLDGHYEIIKELCAALLALDGWESSNHECMFAHINEAYAGIDIDFGYLFDLKDTRNAIDYRGVKISPSTWQDNALKIMVTIDALGKEVERRLKTIRYPDQPHPLRGPL
jgi:hypothetical protein